jgi:hypothetical protein
MARFAKTTQEKTNFINQNKYFDDDETESEYEEEELTDNEEDTFMRVANEVFQSFDPRDKKKNNTEEDEEEAQGAPTLEELGAFEVSKIESVIPSTPERRKHDPNFVIPSPSPISDDDTEDSIESFILDMQRKIDARNKFLQGLKFCKTIKDLDDLDKICEEKKKTQTRRRKKRREEVPEMNFDDESFFQMVQSGRFLKK